MVLCVNRAWNSRGGVGGVSRAWNSHGGVGGVSRGWKSHADSHYSAQVSHSTKTTYALPSLRIVSGMSISRSFNNIKVTRKSGNLSNLSTHLLLIMSLCIFSEQQLVIQLYKCRNTITCREMRHYDIFFSHKSFTMQNKQINRTECMLTTELVWKKDNKSTRTQGQVHTLQNWARKRSMKKRKRYQRYIECHQLIMQKTPLCHKMFSQCGKVMFHQNKNK